MVSKVSKKSSQNKKRVVHVKRHVAKKKSAKLGHTKTAKGNVNNKLDKIITAENKMLREEKKIEQKEDLLTREEKNIESEEKRIESEENNIGKLADTIKKEETDIEKLQKIEEEIKSEVGSHPLAQVTLKDITKGFIGAFIGLAIHYTFVYGVEIAEKMTMLRATIMFPLTFLVGILFIYATGFRKVQDTKLLVYMPVRLLILYICSLIMSILVLYLFYPSFGQSFEASYKMVAGVMLAAVVGACTADLLGKE
jgi:uncharacterized membrane protein